jgi:hypothetical protein
MHRVRELLRDSAPRPGVRAEFLNLFLSFSRQMYIKCDHRQPSCYINGARIKINSTQLSKSEGSISKSTLLPSVPINIYSFGTTWFIAFIHKLRPSGANIILLASLYTVTFNIILLSSLGCKCSPSIQVSLQHFYINFFFTPMRSTCCANLTLLPVM